MTLFKVLYVVSIILALSVGYYLGNKYNPRPAKVEVQKITERKTVEKEIPVEVVVEKQISQLPNFVQFQELEVDCYEISKLKLMPARSRWVPLKHVKEGESGELSYKLEKASRETMYAATKSWLLQKIKCRGALSADEIELLTELMTKIDVQEVAL